MANIQLSWTNPTATDIDNICVHRFDNDQSATYDGTVDATAAATFAGTTTAIVNQNDSSYSYTAGAINFTDEDVVAGTYTYGVFSKNAAGYGPGEAATITIA